MINRYITDPEIQDYLFDRQMEKIADVEHAIITMNWLNELNNTSFLNEIINYGIQLNKVVRDDRFPAFDIAKRAAKNNWTLTEKQRHAITNVYLFSMYGWKQEQLEGWLSKHDGKESQKA